MAITVAQFSSNMVFSALLGTSAANLASFRQKITELLMSENCDFIALPVEILT